MTRGEPFRSPGCWLAQFSEHPCDGRLIRAHLIPKQRVKRELRGYGPAKLAEVLWDTRCWIPACGGMMGNAGHHGAFDQRQLYVPRWALPAGVEEYALEHGLVWSLDRDFGLVEETVA
jgi:hypothetical protein